MRCGVIARSDGIVVPERDLCPMAPERDLTPAFSNRSVMSAQAAGARVRLRPLSWSSSGSPATPNVGDRPDERTDRDPVGD